MELVQTFNAFVSQCKFALKTESRLYSACVRSVMLYASETWPVNEEDVIKDG